MDLLEIPKESKELCINAFKENILNNFNLENLSKLSSTGQLGQKYLRSIAWKIFLGVLSPNDSLEKWKENLAYDRTKYKILSDKIKKQQNFFEEEDKKKEAYNNDIKTSILRQNSIVFNPFRPEKETKNLINLDLSRTFQELSLFHDENFRNKLGHILYVWSVENSDFGYQQGMNDILSIIFLALYPYYFKNDSNEKNDNMSKEEELYLFFNDEDELESDLFICFNNAMKKGIDQFYEFEFSSKEKQDAYIKKICLFSKELENIKTLNNETNLPLYIRCSMIIHEKLKILDNDLYCHFEKIGLNGIIFLQRWVKCVFNREFNIKDVLIIWDSIISSPEIQTGYDLAKIDIIAISMLLRIRNFLLLCDQNQCFMTLLQYPKIENILELIIFSDKINDAINDLLSGKKSLFLENITNFNPNFEKTNNYKIEKIENNEISPIKTYEDGVERLEKILNKYKSLMVNDEKEINNIIKFFKNYK